MAPQLKPKLLVGAAAGLAAAGAGGAIAASKLTSPQAASQAVVSDAAKQLGVQPSELKAALVKAIEKRIDAAVADGRLTKEQAAELKRRLEAGDLPLFGGPALGPPGVGHHFGLFPALPRLRAAASYLDLTDQQLREKLNDGKTLAQIAKDEGKSVEGLVSALVDATKKQLDDAVADGRLTKEQRNAIADGLEARVRDFVNNAQLRIHHDRRGFRVRPPNMSGV